jgi:ribonuclease Z
MTTYVRVLSVSTTHSAPAVVVVSDLNRLLFNCPEGTQRLCVEHKVRLAKTSGIFVTSMDPKAICGLPGIARARR